MRAMISLYETPGTINSRCCARLDKAAWQKGVILSREACRSAIAFSSGAEEGHRPSPQGLESIEACPL
jgi:hypothetical protein